MRTHVALSSPDNFGRVHMSMSYYDATGIFRPEPSVCDGNPVGYRRGQCFFCPPADHHGVKVESDEEARQKSHPVLSDEGRTAAIEQLTYRLEHTGIYGGARRHVVNALAWLQDAE
jgi:hypothetical protein